MDLKEISAIMIRFSIKENKTTYKRNNAGHTFAMSYIYF